MSQNTQNTEENKRLVSIDRFRGFIVFCMIFFQCAKMFDSLGFIRRLADHDEIRGIQLLPGLRLADLFAPMFFFAISLNYIPSLKRRIARDGRKKAYFHFLTRYFAILGCGGIMQTINRISKSFTDTTTFIMMGISVVALLAAILLLIFAAAKKDNLRKKARIVMISAMVLIGIVNLVVGIIDVPIMLSGQNIWKRWGVLQSIGGAGLLMLLFAESNAAIRGVAAFFLFGVYALIHSLPGMQEFIDFDVQGGVIGTIGWCSLMLVSSVMADLYYRDRNSKKDGKCGIKANTYLMGLFVLTALAVCAAFTMVLNMGSVSPGYILLTVAVGAWVFYICALTENFEPKFRFFIWWGYSPIFMFLLQYITEDIIPVFFDEDKWSAVPAALYVLATGAVITYIARRLYRKKINIRF